ncbi:MAG: diguanylate cyclase [Spirochaetales bacterium]|nr:diguanylate cyclase [Spirochaetales bacterium]
MALQFHYLQLLYFFACLLSLSLAVGTSKLPPFHGSRIWRTTLFFIALWSGSDGLLKLFADFSAKQILLRLSYIGVMGTTISWSYFVLVFGNCGHLIGKKLKVLLLVIPSVSFLGVMTFSWHPLFYTSLELVQRNGLWALERRYGPLFWVWAVYAYAIILSSSILLIQAMVRFPKQYKSQISLILAAALLPTIPNVLYLTGINFMSPYDPSSLFFALSGLLIGMSILKFRFFDVTPVAYHAVFQDMKSGVLVLDSRKIVLDINPVAERIFAVTHLKAIGQSLEKLSDEAGELIMDDYSDTAEKKLNGRLYEISSAPLVTPGSSKEGLIIHFHDITALKETEKKLSDANKQLKEIAGTDALTGLLNRRNFFEQAAREFSRSRRSGSSFTMILIDLDNFKAVNDNMGHLAGDDVLRVTAESLVELSRSGDIVGRYGGDEFIIMPFETDEDHALELAKRYVSEIPLRIRGVSEIPVTLSIGIILHDGSPDTSLEDVFDRADTAMYASKAAGKNQASLWTPEMNKKTIKGTL